MPRRSSPKSDRPPQHGEDVLSPHNLPYQMRLLVQLLTRRFQGVIEPFNLTPLHWGILSCLWQRDGLPTQTIASQLEQLGGTVTIGLDAMEKRGIIKRKRDARDRRVSRVWLTPTGRDLRHTAVPPVAAFVEKIFSCFSAEERDGFTLLVHRLKAHVEGT